MRARSFLDIEFLKGMRGIRGPRLRSVRWTLCSGAKRCSPARRRSAGRDGVSLFRLSSRLRHCGVWRLERFESDSFDENLRTLWLSKGVQIEVRTCIRVPLSLEQIRAASGHPYNLILSKDAWWTPRSVQRSISQY